jgi:TRAP-type C4-dicarboxylate transport system permease small subunit
MKKTGIVSGRASKIFDNVITRAAYLSGYIIIFMMFSISYEVTMRYFFIKPTGWVMDFSGYMQYVCVLLGSAWVLKIGSHTRMDILLNRFRPWVQTLLNLITSSIALVACAIFGWKGFEATWDAYQSGEFLYREVEVPLSILFAFIPFTFLLLCIQFGRQIYKQWQTLRRPSV